jgi:MFS family permease
MRPPRLLAARDFRRWYLSRSASVTGTAASAVALPLLTYQTTGSALVTSAVAALEALPYLLFGLFAGAAADRWRRKRMMVSADLVCALLMLTVPAAHALGLLTTAHVLIVAGGLGAGFCWFDAAAWGALTRIAGKARLPEANSLIWSTGVVLGIAVPALSGALAAATSPAMVLTVPAGAYLASAAWIARLRGDLDAASGPDAARGRVRRDIAEGLRYLWREPSVRTLSLTGFGLSAAGGGAVALLVVHADEVLGLARDDRRIGVLYAAAAAGALLGAVLLPSLGRRLGQGMVSIIGYGVFTVALVGLAVTTSFVAAVVWWAVWDLASSTAITNGITVRQQLTPDELQGRVNTTGRMIAWGGTPFGALLGGACAEAFGVQVAYLVLAVPALAGLVVLLNSPVRQLRIQLSSGSFGGR